MSCNIAPEDVEKSESCKTTGGLAVKLYWAEHKSVLTWPTTSDTDYEASVTAADDFVMKPGERFHYLDCDLEMGSKNSESQGNKGSLSAANRIEFAQSGENKKLTAFINSNKNKHLVFLAKTANGTVRQIGTENLPAMLEAFNENSGKAAADAVMAGFTAYAPGDLPAYYEGVIPLTPAP